MDKQAMQVVGEIVDELQRRHGTLLIQAEPKLWTVTVTVVDTGLPARSDSRPGEAVHRESGNNLPTLLATIRETMRRQQEAE